MKNFTPEIINKAKKAKSVDELISIAKENDVELTAEEAKTYFDQLNANGAVSDDELDLVSGGGGCPDEEEEKEEKNNPQSLPRYITCPHCSVRIPWISFVCPVCQKSVHTLM